MNRYVIGDVHGAYKALLQVLERSGFNYKEDLLISLGDTVDGWSEPHLCVKEYLKMNRFIGIEGNHDNWFIRYLKLGYADRMWLQQGGLATQRAYLFNTKMMDEHYEKFFSKLRPYYIDENNNLFVHAGYDHNVGFEYSVKENYLWDRDLYQTACRLHTKGYKFPEFNKIFIGHTATIGITDEPHFVCNVVNVDQGAGWFGKLTLMNIDTLEYFQSDNVQTLYPDETGRRR